MSLRKRKASDDELAHGRDKKAKPAAKQIFAPTDYPNHHLWKQLSRKLLLAHLHDDTLGIVQAYLHSIHRQAPQRITYYHGLSSTSVSILMDPLHRQWIVHTLGCFRKYDMASGKMLGEMDAEFSDDDDEDAPLNFCVMDRFLVFTGSYLYNGDNTNHLYVMDRDTGVFVKRVPTMFNQSVAVCSPWRNNNDQDLQRVLVVARDMTMFTLDATYRLWLQQNQYRPPPDHTMTTLPLLDAVLDRVVLSSAANVTVEDNKDALTYSVHVETRNLNQLREHVHSTFIIATSVSIYGPGLLAVSGDQCFFKTEKDTDTTLLHAVHLVTGEQLWERVMPEGIEAMAVDPLTSCMLCSNREGRLFVLDYE